MFLQPAKRLGEVKEYYFSRKLKEIAQMRAAGKNVLNLGIGSPDLAPSESAIAVLITAAKNEGNHAYQSYSGIPELREAFVNWYAKYFKVELNPALEILPLIGSKEGIMHISMTYLEEGDEVLIPNPGYPAYRAVSNLVGATAVEYELSEARNWLPDLKKLAERDLTKVKIMWVNYPNMPTGKNAPFSFFEELIAFAKKHEILVVNDNPYSFILNNNPQSLLAVEGAKEVAMELNSLSKSHNMAGWRMGMLAGKAEYVQTILRFKSNMDSGMFKPLQLAAVEALNNPQAWYNGLNEIYAKRREKVYELLDVLDCEYDKNGVGMFVWAKIPKVYENGFALADEVLEKCHVFITPGGIFGSQGDGYIRVSLCGKVAAFEEAIERLHLSF
ncbi:MAG: LL-diaminopimelate aminotransferase [Paraglaciecola sp.]|jgi:LL-diaminopimelate aminotransferase